MRNFHYQANDLNDTLSFGTRLAAALPEGSVIALSGTLGSGKTQLVQAVAAACGVDPRDVTSPTFVLVNEYQGNRPIYHFDAYRIRDDDEFLQLGPEEYFEGNGLTFVEWAERVETCLPRERLHIQIAVLGDTTRAFAVTATGGRYEGVIEALSSEAP